MAEAEEHLKGRKRLRDDHSEEPVTNESHAAARSSEVSVDGQPNKSRNKFDYDKRFECKFSGCGKSYSRAEHLYRHQLNREYILDIETLRLR